VAAFLTGDMLEHAVTYVVRVLPEGSTQHPLGGDVHARRGYAMRCLRGREHWVMAVR
jgi:hypothetical protein